MVGFSRHIVWWCLALSMTAAADDGYVRTWVDKTDVQAEKPFRLHLEISGDSIGDLELQKSDDIIVNVQNPQTFRRSMTVSTPTGFKRTNVVRYSFRAWAIKEGEITIPPISATVGGQKLSSEPIILNVTTADPADQYDSEAIRMWVSRKTVNTGEWFWIYLETTGFDVDMPDTLDVDGLYFDADNMQRSVTSSFSRRGVKTYKRGYYARADRPGEVSVPSVELMVSGRQARSNSLSIRVAGAPTTRPGQQAAPKPEPADKQEVLTENDLIFIEMNVDKRDVYMGEPILLTTQLWQIIYRNISSGPYRGALNVQPTTSGFYVNELDPIQYETTRGPWKYTVTERRKLLYPTRKGELEIGAWHWEGIALFNRQSFARRGRINRTLDQGPYTVNVRGLPDAPEGFSGTVGDFQVHSQLTSNAVKAGQPINLLVVIRGQGNSDAIGAPEIPDLVWAHVSEPDRDTRFHTDPGENLPSVTKTFTYTITPLEGGDERIPEFDYIVFNPSTSTYETETLGPYRMTIQGEEVSSQHLLVPNDIAILHRAVDVVADDIYPMLDAPSSLERSRSNTLVTSMALAIPPVAYFGLILVMAHRRRLASDVGYSRDRNAKHKGIRRLEEVFKADEPEDELFKTVAGYIGDRFNVHDPGLTSSDVTDLLDSHGVEPGLVATFQKIMKSCERSRYAAEPLSVDELRALVQASETAIHAFDDWRKSGAAK